MTSGAIFPLDPIDEKTRQKIDLTEALKIGNHKGTIKQPPVLKNLMANVILRGFSLPIPLERVIQCAVMAPQNMARQNSIDETGKIIDKDRLNHDQSWVYTSGGPSMNDHVCEIELIWPNEPPNDSLYRGNLSLIPQRKLFIDKFDWKSAYCQEHVNWLMAIQTIT
jgi:hypothetical protein